MLRLSWLTNGTIGRSCTPRVNTGIWPQSTTKWLNHFHCALGFATRILAHMFDSLVRVSRRVGSSNFARITNAERWDIPAAKAYTTPSIALLSKRPAHSWPKAPQLRRVSVVTSIQSTVEQRSAITEVTEATSYLHRARYICEPNWFWPKQPCK